MARFKSYILGGATLICALAIGYVMQFGLALPGQSAAAPDQALDVTDIQPASSAVQPRLPVDAAQDQALPDQTVTLAAVDAALEDETPELGDLPGNPAAGGFDCGVELVAKPAAGAMADLTLTAPCKASERVTFHHQGLMFTETVQPDGTLSLSVPALAQQAVFIASFANGDGAMAMLEVSSLDFYDRVAVQWTGGAGLQLHAREYGAAYFTDGHVWAAASGDLAAAARGEGGFLVRLGAADAPKALLAEIYSFPSGTARTEGEIAISVEAEVTEANCDQTVEAQTLELRGPEGLRVRDLTLDIPACDSTGDFLVLKNLVEDMKIAGR
ncbi:hypothetical protein [Pseudoponticoccus marisrubri]|uniref:Translocase n=1 Tax=Pseudoponticoccus marisrubri TaxID=1685382 RepID=A0A0W7WJH4_9RHOB|nr:hypothetical protein [Pseudoponticoccus marisrubri]KUF10676.1 translocase [Pseudoponticoccus marisrubri]